MPKTILIAGASSGLGRQLCELYAREGCTVGAIGRRGHLLEELQQQHPDQIVPFPFDISEDDCYERMNQFIDHLGGIDILIVTASIVRFNQELFYEIEKDVIDTNIKGYIAVLNAGYHYFKKKGNGQIVGVTSIAAARGNKTTLAYNASKAFQSSYLESLRLKLLGENKNIFVTELVPGYMDTEMGKGDRLFWVASIEKSGRLAKKAIDQKKRKAYITRRWQLIFILYRIMPSFIYSRLIHSKLKLQKRD